MTFAIEYHFFPVSSVLPNSDPFSPFFWVGLHKNLNLRFPSIRSLSLSLSLFSSSSLLFTNYLRRPDPAPCHVQSLFVTLFNFSLFLLLFLRLCHGFFSSFLYLDFLFPLVLHLNTNKKKESISRFSGCFFLFLFLIFSLLSFA